MEEGNAKACKSVIGFYQIFALLFVSRAITVLTIALLDNREVFNLQSALILPVAHSALILGILPFYFLYRQSGLNVLDTASQKIHSALGKFLGVLYAGYFFLIIVRSTMRFSHFVSTVLINDLPLPVFLGMLFIGALYTAFRGLEPMGRVSTAISLLIVLLFAMITIAAVPSLSLQHIEPLDYNPQQGATFAADYFSHSSELVALGLLISRGKGNFKQGFGGWLALNLVLTELFILLPQAALGRYTEQVSFPFYELTTIPKQGIFQRMDAIYANIWIFGILIQTALLLYLFELSLRGITGGRWRRSIIAGCLAAVALSLYFLNGLSNTVIQFIFRFVSGGYTLILLAIPLLLLLILRRKKKQPSAAKDTKKAAGIALIMIMSATLLSGCHSGSQTQALLFVETIGIDKDEEGYLLTVQVFDPLHAGPTFQSQTGPITRLDSCKGKSIMEAFQSLVQSTGQRVTYSKNRIVIIGEEVAREGLYQVLDYLLRTQEKRSSVYMVITQGQASQVVRSTMADSVTPALDMMRIISNAEQYGLGHQMRILDVINVLLEESSSLSIPVVKAMQQDTKTGQKEELPPQEEQNKKESAAKKTDSGDSGGSSGGGGGGSSEGGSGGGEQSVTMEMNGVAIFRQDRLEEYLTQEEVPGLLWLMGKAQHVINTFPFGESHKATVQIVKSKVDIQADLSEATPKFTFTISGSASLLGLSPYQKNPFDEGIFTEIEQQYNREVERQCREILDKVILDWGYDVLQLGRLLRVRQGAYWSEHYSDWEEILKQCRFEVRTNLKLTNIGNTLGQVGNLTLGD